jgi:hypothetical protein
MAYLILLREQRAKRAFFRSDLEVVHIHNKCGKQGEGYQVRQECRPPELKQQEAQIHWIPRALVDAFRSCRLYGSQYAPAELRVIRPEPPDQSLAKRRLQRSMQ